MVKVASKIVVILFQPEFLMLVTHWDGVPVVLFPLVNGREWVVGEVEGAAERSNILDVIKIFWCKQ